MAKYLTLPQYKNTDSGIAVTNLTDMALSRIIGMAEFDIDAFMGFDNRLGGFEPGSTIFQTQWDNVSHRVDIPAECLPVRQILRFDIQLSNISSTGAGFEAIISPNDVAINNFEGYLQIIPLSAVTYSMFPTIVGMGLDPAIVLVEVSSGYYIPFFNDVLIDAGDHLTYWSLRGFWATSYNLAPSLKAQNSSVIPTIPAVITVDNVAPVGSYTVDPLNGSVTFAVARTSSNVVRASYATEIPDYVREATLAQTNYYLRLRALNQAGTFPEHKRIQSGDQMVMIQDGDKLVMGVNGALCNAAANKLASFDEIGIA